MSANQFMPESRKGHISMSVAQKTRVSVPSIPATTNLVNKTIKPYDITVGAAQKEINSSTKYKDGSWVDILKVQDIYKDTSFVQTLDSSPLTVIEDF